MMGRIWLRVMHQVPKEKKYYDILVKLRPTITNTYIARFIWSTNYSQKLTLLTCHRSQEIGKRFLPVFDTFSKTHEGNLDYLIELSLKNFIFVDDSIVVGIIYYFFKL